MTIEITPKLLSELEAKAKLASAAMDVYTLDSACHEYMQSVSPTIVLALIVRIRKLEYDLDDLRYDNRAKELAIESLNKEVDWLAHSHKCKTASQYRGMSGVCPAIHSEKDSGIKPCGVFGRPFYTQDECAALWRKAAREAVSEVKNA